MSINTQNKEEIKRASDKEISQDDIQIVITLSVMAIVIFALFIIFYLSTNSTQNKSNFNQLEQSLNHEIIPEIYRSCP